MLFVGDKSHGMNRKIYTGYTLIYNYSEIGKSCMRMDFMTTFQTSSNLWSSFK